MGLIGAGGGIVHILPCKEAASSVVYMSEAHEWDTFREYHTRRAGKDGITLYSVLSVAMQQSLDKKG